ncbi:acetyltransferase [Vibrio breoganii]|uniref:acetyltransferase n=1 Tax=Vibrio breoganii TaxID=553239 RepID=UPI000C8303EF|nr:acetyltransferase [Vibrio breoganii]PML20715.1 acetyltransferase [Vibrio breoganii]
MKVLAIVGASGHGGVVADIAECLGYEKIVFFDDAWPELDKFHHWNVIGNTDSLIADISKYDECFVAIGNCKTRTEKTRLLLKKGAKIPTLIHPSSTISKYVNIGQGSIVCEGAIIKAFCSIGDACIINTGATVGHDVNVGNGVHISLGSNIAGAVEIQDNSWIGIGSTVKQGVYIGREVMVGAGAVVIRDVDDLNTVVGCPARPIVK